MACRRLILFTVLILAGMVACTAAAPAPKMPAGPSPAWKLAFVRGGDIWLAHGDGSGQHRIIRNGEAPAWSPDRKQLAFARGDNVWVAKADGTGERQVSFLGEVAVGKPEQSAPERGIDISWDRVRDMLTFSRQETYWVERDGKRGALWGATIYQAPLHPQPPHVVLQALWDFTDEGADFNLTYHAHPAWARDGRHLAFARNGDIWVGEREPEEKADPEWARRWDWDVTRVAAVARYDAPTYRASRENDAATHLSWSLDGKTIAYAWQRLRGSGTEEIHLLETATGKERLIANYGVDPCFSPDGKWIAYKGVPEDKEGIWVILAEGKGDRQLIKEGTEPAW